MDFDEQMWLAQQITCWPQIYDQGGVMIKHWGLVQQVEGGKEGTGVLPLAYMN